ncbi:MAG: hypothetical protein HGA19_21605 [Oscillochloris sp.]|nr:hypothetical protein [Oscillochloris sp.]
MSAISPWHIDAAANRLYTHDGAVKPVAILSVQRRQAHTPPAAPALGWRLPLEQGRE